MPLLYLSSAWLLGTYLGAKILFPMTVLFLGLIPLCLLIFLPHHRKQLLLLSFCLLAFFGATFRFQTTQLIVNEQHLSFYHNREIVEITGIVSSDPEIKDNAQFIQLSISEIRVNNETKKVSGKALIRTSRYPDYSYGDILRVTGKLEAPPNLYNFDYKAYLERQGIYSLIYYPKIEILDRGKGHKLLQWLYSLRHRLSQILTMTLPEPQGALAKSIVLGIRGDIPPSLNQAFSRTGTAHLLAISGLHLSIILGMFLSLNLWLWGKRYSLYIWLALLAIWLYAFLTAARPPIVRGAIMGSLFLLAEYFGRQRNAIIALVFAAALMVAIKPLILWDASFQLSFLAMAGLIFLSPLLQNSGKNWLLAIFNNKGIASVANLVINSFAVTLGAIMTTFPLIAYYFGTASLVSLPATFLTLLALPGIIVMTILTCFLGLLFLPLAQVLAWVDWLFLSYFLLIIRIYDFLPLSSFPIDSIHPWQVWAYYVCLALTLSLASSKKQVAGFLSKTFSYLQQLAQNLVNFLFHLPKKWIIPPLLVIAILLWTAILTLPDNRLHVSFLNVGQGDAILIQTPNRQDILIDGGPSPQAINLELSKKLPFWDRTIDLVILTQPEADHVTGLVEVLHRYQVKQVLEPGTTSNTPAYQEWRRVVLRKQISHNLAQAGQIIDLGKGISLEVLNPPSPLLQGTADDIDNNGIVLRLTWGEISFLFTADIQEEAELKLIARRAHLKSTVLKVAHHGSRTSTSPEFLALVAPQIAVICVSKDNRFSHPHPEVIERLKTKLNEGSIYLTAKYGTIEFITDGKRLWAKTGL